MAEETVHELAQRLPISARNVTNPAQAAKNAIPGPRALPALTAPRANRLFPCQDWLPCWLQANCCATRRTYVPPKIRPKVFATEIQQITIRPFKGKVDGIVTTAVKNESEEGKVIVRTNCRCKGGSEGVRTTPVSGSAIIDTVNKHVHEHIELARQRMEEMWANARKIEPEVAVTVQGRIYKEGIRSVLQGMIDALKSWAFHTPQSMRVTADIQSQVSYDWLGNHAVEDWEFNIADVPLPVRNFKIDWSLG